MSTALAIALVALSVVGLVSVLAVLRLADAHGSPANFNLIVPTGLVAIALGVIGLVGLFG